jgi:hypothetical protein
MALRTLLVPQPRQGARVRQADDLRKKEAKENSEALSHSEAHTSRQLPISYYFPPHRQYRNRKAEKDSRVRLGGLSRGHYVNVCV